METGSENRFSSDWRTDPNHEGHNSHMEEPHHSPSSSSSQNPFLNHCDSHNNIGNRGMMNNDNSSTNVNSMFPSSSEGNPFSQDQPKTQIQDHSFGAFDTWDNQPTVCENVPKDQGHQNSLDSGNLGLRNSFSDSSSEISSDSSDDELEFEIEKALSSLSSHSHAQPGDDVSGQHSKSSSISSTSKEKSSEIQNPPAQVMERPEGGDTGYVFPPHVFDKNTNNPTGEWSTASNESLFSIYMGNMSFTSELMCINNKSLTELDKPNAEMFMLDTPPNAPPKQQQQEQQQQQPNASPIQQKQPPPQPLATPPVSKFTDISQRTAELHEENSKANEAKAFETMREVIMETSRTTESAAAKGGDGNSRRQSDGSTQSFAFQSSSRKDKSAESKGVEEKQKQQNQTENKQQEAAPKAAIEAPNNKKFLFCFPCCCPFG